MKRFIFCIIVFNLLFFKVLGNTSGSLENMLNRAASDTAKVMIYNRFARDLLSGQNPDFNQALQYAQEGLRLAEQTLFNKGQAELNRTIGNVFYFLNDFDQAVEHYNIALDLCEKLQDTKGIALNSYNLGISYREQSKIYHSLEAHQKALSIWKQSGDTNYMIKAYKSIVESYRSVEEFKFAEVYAKEALGLAIKAANRQEEASLNELLGRISFETGDTLTTKEYFQKSLHINEELDNQLQIARITHNFAVRLFSDNPRKSIDLLRKAVAIYEKISPDNYQLYSIYNSIANIFLYENQDDSTSYYKEKALAQAIRSGNLQTMAKAYNTSGMFYMNEGDISRAENDFHKAYDIAVKNGLYKAQSDAMSGISSVNYQKGDYKTAFEYFRRYQVVNDSLSREENKENIRQLTMQYEFEKDMKEKNEIIKAQLEQQQQAVNYQKIIVVIVSITLICAAIMLGIIFRANKRNKQANVKLKAQNAEIVKHHDLIAHQKKEITDSIIYARRIQRAMLPMPKMLKDDLEMYIFYRPRDIISGDFYWMTKRDDRLIIVVADCTGHGVPGAFMSMLGITFLNEIVGKENEVLANEILNKLRDNVVRSLNQTGRLKKEKEYTRDGMDIALCVIDYPRMFLQYAGAYNPLILIRNGELREIKANRMPVAYSDDYGKKKFTNNLISLLPNDCIYMFSDGFADQFGGNGEKSKKYSVKRLKSTLLNVCELPMKKQKRIMAIAYDDWKGDHEQIDDVLLVGIRI